MRIPRQTLYLCMVCIAGMLGCRNTTPQKKFFDIPAYFRKEIKTLQTNAITISKSSTYNGHRSQQDLRASNINWEKELAVFLEADINKPAYLANMRVDSTAYPGKGYQLMYTATSPKLSIRHVVINMKEEEELVNIDIEKSNLISTTHINAYYLKGKRYAISGEQAVQNLGDQNQFFIEGNFLK